MNLKRKLHLLSLLAILFFSANCSKQEAADDTITATFSSIYSKLLSTTCISCHVPGGAATNDGAEFDLTSKTTAFNTLTGGNAAGPSSSGCGNVPLVDASNANGSIISAVLFEDIHSDDFVETGCTPYNVHHSDQNISSDERSALLGWINAGANND